MLVLEKVARAAGKTGINSSHYSDLSQVTNNLHKILTGSGMKLSGNVSSKLIEAALNYFTSENGIFSSLSEMNTNFRTILVFI